MFWVSGSMEEVGISVKNYVGIANGTLTLWLFLGMMRDSLSSVKAELGSYGLSAKVLRLKVQIY
jgi:hypothetical protein